MRPLAPSSQLRQPTLRNAGPHLDAGGAQSTQSPHLFRSDACRLERAISRREVRSMTMPALSRLTQSGGGASTFDVRRRHGVWQVMRDGAFYGDFPVRQSAIDAVRAAARLP